MSFYDDEYDRIIKAKDQRIAELEAMIKELRQDEQESTKAYSLSQKEIREKDRRITELEIGVSTREDRITELKAALREALLHCHYPHIYNKLKSLLPEKL